MMACEAAAKLNQAAAAIAECTATLALDPRRVDALLHRATGHELAEDFDAATRDLKAVCCLGPFYFSLDCVLVYRSLKLARYAMVCFRPARWKKTRNGSRSGCSASSGC